MTNDKCFMARLVEGCLWLYAAVVVAAWVALRWGGDRWWWATFLLFCPRWLWAAPLAVFLPAMAIWRRRRWWLTGAAAAWVLGPLMGLCVAWPARPSAPSDGPVRLRVMTCNVGLGGYDLETLAKLIIDEQIDVATLQEEAFAVELANLLPERWQLWSNQEIVLVSRFPLLDQRVLPREPSVGRGTVAIDFQLDTPQGPIDFVAVHLYTPRKGLEAVKDTFWQGIGRMYANLEKRSRESLAAHGWIAQLAGPVVVAGDLNLPPESAVFRRDWAEYTDAFSAAGTGFGYTFGYTHSGRWYGIRIDHVLAGTGWHVERAWVGPHVGSDHRPMIAELAKRGGEAAGSGQEAVGRKQ